MDNCVQISEGSVNYNLSYHTKLFCVQTENDKAINIKPLQKICSHIKT